jgi:hypothetical protein
MLNPHRLIAAPPELARASICIVNVRESLIAKLPAAWYSGEHLGPVRDIACIVHCREIYLLGIYM